MYQKTKSISLGLLALAGSIVGTAQLKQLNEDQYFKGNLNALVQTLPTATRWIDNSHFLLLKDSKTFIVDAATGNEREATAADNSASLVQPKPFVKDNDIFIRIGDKDEKLTDDKDKEANPVLSPDGNYVAYTKNNDLYTVNLSSKKETRLTHDGSDVILNGYASWVYMEEILGRSTQYKAFWWSPDSKQIAFFRFDDSKVPVFTITDGPGKHGLVEKERYPKVGDPNPEVKIGMIAPAGGQVVWADFNEKDDQYFGTPFWKPGGAGLLVQWLNRKQNNLKIWEVDRNNGSKKIFYEETQKTWITLKQAERLRFLKNGKGMLLLSDVSGWNHIYYYDMNGKLIQQLTSGKFTVTDLNEIDEKNSYVYFSARGIENTARKDFYRVKLSGKGLQRLSFGDYNNTISSISPAADYFITNYANAGTPAKLALLKTNGKLVKILGDSKTATFDEYELAKTEVIRVKSNDGFFDLPMKVTWPLHMDSTKKYPVLISVYGGPDAGNVMDTWTLTGNQQWFAKEGLIQVAMDHRASGHFGKEAVNYMYHDFGKWEMEDYSTMVKWLVAHGHADSTKICITGFSYGGYVSAYALTYGAGVFTHGMAGGSVVDWTLYDSHYTERFMGTMEDNAEGYRRSNVLNYTDRYKGMLQIVHGVMDDNVHMQNSLQLISKLQDEKKDFEFMVYPGGRHGWGNLPAKNAHFSNLKNRFIYRYLLEKDMPAGLAK